jgi:catecholate siderophore receptor
MKTRQHMQKNRKKARRGPRYWVVSIGTMGALVAFTVGNSHAVALGYARRAPAAVTAYGPQTQGRAQARRFDIPAGTLETVLTTFQSLTGLQVIIPNDAMRGISSPGVSGAYTAEQALAQLLTGTGLAYRHTAAETLTLEIQAAHESVEVTERTSPLSSPKYTAPLRDIPQTITVIPREVIEEQGATTLRDVLRNVPGLTMTAGEGGAPAGDNLTLRGFSARNDIFVDGVRDLGPQSRDPFNIEQVEVVKGPGSAYTGRGSAGGAINLTSKTPGFTPSYGGTLNLGNARMKRATADINAPLARLGLGERTSFRLNLLAHDSGVAGRDVVEEERWGVAPSLGFSLGGRTRVTLGYFHLRQDNVSDYGIPWVPATNNALAEYRDRPAPVPRDTFYGFKERDRERLRSDLATFRLEHDYDDNLRLTNQLRYGRSTRDSMATPPRFADVNSTVINREMRSWLTEDDIWDNQTDLRASFGTGGVRHTLVTGLALTRERNQRVTRTAANAQTTLLDPNPNDVFTGPILLNPFAGDITADSQALYAFDTARVGEKWEFNGGLRWDRFDAEGVTVGTTTAGVFAPGAPVARVDRMLSFRAGAVFKPRPEGSVYAAYGTSLSPSLEGLSYGTATAAIEPEKTYTFEAGSKWEMFGSRLLLSGALFRVEKTNARTPGLPGEPPQVLDGEQRVDGVEVSASGSVVRGWQLFAAYTLLDSEIVKSNTPAEVGREILNTPRNSFSLWTTYTSRRRLEVGGGARFVGRRFGNNTNTRQVEGYWLLDLMASYPLSRNIDLRLNINNLTDEYYFDRIGGGHLVPGAARTVMLSTGFRF